MADKKNMVLAIDIGSSRVHVGLIDAEKRICLRRSDFPRQEVHKRLAGILDKWRGRSRPLPAVIAGGRDGMAGEVGEILSSRDIPSAALRWNRKLPVRFRYIKPEQLGADRIAHALFAADSHPGRNTIIISAGTAITADVIIAGREFTGGVILPGAQVQLQSLHTSTILPEAALTGRTDFPGTSTESCMRAGVMHGIAGALSHFVKKYRSQKKGRWVILATGGGWPGLSNLVDFKPVYLPDMTLVGIGMYATTVLSAGPEV